MKSHFGILVTGILVAACGGENADDVPVDAADASQQVDGAASIDSPDAIFRVITHSPLFGLGRARLVAYRHGVASWSIAPETANGEYTGPAGGTTLDVVIVCQSVVRDAVDVQFVHLAPGDSLTLSFPCATEGATARVTGTLNPAGSRLQVGRVTSVSSASTIDLDVPVGTVDAVGVSSIAALVLPDLVLNGPTTLNVDIAGNGSPLGQTIPITVVGAAQDETVTLRSGIRTRNGVSASTTNGLFPLAQVGPGDVRFVSAFASVGAGTRGVTSYDNADTATTATLPARTTAASLTRERAPAIGEFSWSGAFPNRSGINVSVSDGDEDSTRVVLVFLSQRRLASSGMGDSGSYRFPDVASIPGWETSWNLLGVEGVWRFTVQGESVETSFGAAPAPGTVRWSATLNGSALAPTNP